VPAGPGRAAAAGRRRLLGTGLVILLLLGAARPPGGQAFAAPGRPAPEASPPAVVAPAAPPRINAQAWALLEPESGTLLASGSGNAPRAPASLVKIMTLFLVWEALAGGSVTWDTEVAVSAYAANVGGSRLGLAPGDRLTVREVVGGLAVASANDGARAVAEHLAGSVDAFVETMNRRAEELGLSVTRFANADGWDAPGQVTTAVEVARLAAAYLRDHPEAVTFHRQPSLEFRGRTYRNFNGLVARDPTVDGLKTGMTAAAGWNLVATASRDGTRLIAVVLGAPTERSREDGAHALLEYGFAHYAVVRVPAGEAAGTVPVSGGRRPEAAAVTGAPLAVTVPRGRAAEVTRQARPHPAVAAPVEPGQPVGELVLLVGPTEVGRVTLVAGEEVPRAGRLARLWQAFLEWVRRMLRPGQ